MNSSITNKYSELIGNKHKAYSFTFEKKSKRRDQIYSMFSSTLEALKRWLITELTIENNNVNEIIAYSKSILDTTYCEINENDNMNYAIYMSDKNVIIDIFINNKKIIKKEFNRIVI